MTSWFIEMPDGTAETLLPKHSLLPSPFSVSVRFAALSLLLCLCLSPLFIASFLVLSQLTPDLGNLPLFCNFQALQASQTAKRSILPFDFKFECYNFHLTLKISQPNTRGISSTIYLSSY